MTLDSVLFAAIKARALLKLERKKHRCQGRFDRYNDDGLFATIMGPVANGSSGRKSEVASTSHEIITISDRVSRARQTVRKEEMSAKKGVPLIIDNGM